MRFPLCGVALALGLCIAPFAAAEQAPLDFMTEVRELHVDDVYAGRDGERRVEVYLRALDHNGEPVDRIRPVDVAIWQDDRRVDSEDLLIRPFAELGRGVTCVLAVDVSRTMGGEPFARAKEAALNFLNRLGSHDRVAVVTFGRRSEVLVPFRAGRDEARVRLEALEIDSDALSTVLFDGIYQSVQLIRQTEGLPRRSFVVVFSDGENQGGTHTLEEIVEMSSGNRTDPHVLLYTIGYSRFDGSGLQVMRRLAEETGADFRAISSKFSLGSLDQFYQDIWDGLQRSFVIEFPARMDGTSHEIRVEIDEEIDRRVASYPHYPWPWRIIAAIALGVLVLVAALLLWVLARRDPGRLVFASGSRSGETIRLRRGRTRIGALADNDIVVPVSTVSRYHAEFVVEGSQVRIQDLQSANGTQVNGEDVATRVLRPGDRVVLAREVELEYQR